MSERRDLVSEHHPALLKVAELGEHGVLERIRARVPPAPPWVTVGIGDDAAVGEPMRGRLDVVTTDAMVEGVHFDRAFGTPADLGHKALAINLSDLAAMGAEPRIGVLSLVLPPDLL
ncbi:MAG: AIR synthase related protein, partial [Vicinamibacterales bacterium]|nr:AIR synthase related protein [Vicinamibacterales bacterium]